MADIQVDGMREIYDPKFSPVPDRFTVHGVEQDYDEPDEAMELCPQHPEIYCTIAFCGHHLQMAETTPIEEVNCAGCLMNMTQFTTMKHAKELETAK